MSPALRGSFDERNTGEDLLAIPDSDDTKPKDNQYAEHISAFIMKIMALDVGARTIGVAFSDETGTLAFPGETIIRQEGKRRDMAALRRLIAERNVQAIVVGMPLMLDGRRGIQAEKVEAFVAILRNSVRIPIHLQDERLSTSEAERVLMEGNRNREERKRVVDSVAASLILQAYLDRERSLASSSLEELEELEEEQY